MDASDVKEAVREKYSAAARAVNTAKGSCRGPSKASGCDAITSNLYDTTQTDALPETAVLVSLGCGNPTALAQLSPGEMVLDLG